MSSKRIFLSPPSVDQRERELLLEALDSNWIAPLGPCVDAFEKALAIRAVELRRTKIRNICHTFSPF